MFKSIIIKTLKRGIGILGALGIILAVNSCSDDDKLDSGAAYNPNQAVEISRFLPEEAGYQDQIIIYGSNFGNKKENVSLKIGGKDAVVVNVMNDKLYAFVPSGAFSGEIELTVTDDNGEHGRTIVSDKKITYVRKKVVGTLVGYQNEQDDQGEIWGSFDIAAGFNAEGCLKFDPLNPNLLYIAYDRGDGFIAQLDLANRTATKILDANRFQNQRLRNIDFTLDGKYMLVSTDRADNSNHSTSVWVIERGGNGSFLNRTPQVLYAYKQCNGVAVHPVNGEIYFNSYENGSLFRGEFEDYLEAMANPIPDLNNPGKTFTWTGYIDDTHYTTFRELYRIQDPSYEFQITIHPSGDYAYITIVNRNVIMRTDYDWNKKEFTTPYVIAGLNSNLDDGGWEDAVGTNARIHRPYQGVFVYNAEYEKQGKEDLYDFYFCDCLNFCVRYITPDGLVRTYAGRAPSTNGNIWGTEDGDIRQQARFRDVTGLAYDQASDIFYVLDHNNRRVRTISLESEENIDLEEE
ncbi:MAG: phospholipase [Bacteroidales bacterium]|nr:phospholipase [Bacteroidales bacterium]MBD5234800.1 phospholipase [Barnesiella sp.]MBD5257224.1 phospholipase [Barnesiella sp.]